MSTKRQTLEGTTIADPPPPDLAVMRETTQIVLGGDSGPHPLLRDDEVATLTEALLGHLELLLPQAEQAAARLPRNSVTRSGAMHCVAEARGKLRAPELGFAALAGSVTYARRLARVLVALCEHYEIVSAGVEETPEQRAFVRLAEHCLRCPTCRTVDDRGWNARLFCEEERRLYGEYRRACARAAATRRVSRGRCVEASA
ncbi:DUF6415 family natural product biosynthesis protein [Streptomyces sp. Go-475]|uniref:DUF6415 family natural product biosynthesis protein n=1 Tax=Streptomyces sp. Go-475 TaxID=2072505 RepID=UPI000DEF5A61|nr:DUF6415 family natural product biosynthesis protein [Streptomyces sp. Go-475]AXE85574.1 hypothetical protein C1703_11215 [Streptomyces sp. Go-475]